MKMDVVMKGTMMPCDACHQNFSVRKTDADEMLTRKERYSKSTDVRILCPACYDGYISALKKGEEERCNHLKKVTM
jgi:hypothetical protein